MKSKVAFLSLISFLFCFAAVAQEVESDDMYFNSKDRAKLNLAKASQKAEYTASIKKSKREQAEDETSNPTDSYSARNVNPEYEARTNAQSAQSDNQDYFVNNYRYNNSSNLNTWNNNFNSRYNNPWYSANYWGPSINSWNTPYYGSYYDSWGNPWANPYYRSGFSSSFSYYWGNSYNYGWGMNYGYGNPYYGYNPYGGYSNWGMYSGFGMYGYNNYGYGGYGYPANVVIIENGNRHGPVYGKRNSRSSELNREYNNGSTRSNNRGYVDSGNGGRPVTGGRTSTTTAPSRQSDYYNRGWRNQSENSSYGSGSSSPTNTRSSWESGARSSYRENSGGSTYSPSRSSGGFDSGRSSGGGSSSGGTSGGGSSSGSRSGGRGN